METENDQKESDADPRNAAGAEDVAQDPNLQNGENMDEGEPASPLVEAPVPGKDVRLARTPERNAAPKRAGDRLEEEQMLLCRH